MIVRAMIARASPTISVTVTVRYGTRLGELKNSQAGPGEATENHFTFASGGWYPPDPH